MEQTMVKVADASEIEDGKLHAAMADGRSVLLTRYQGRVVAVANFCPHMGMPMTRGKFSDGVLQCPWHGSRFDMCTGQNLDWVNSFAGIPVPGWTRKLLAMGKAPAPLESLKVEERDGAVYVSPPTVGKKRG